MFEYDLCPDGLVIICSDNINVRIGLSGYDIISYVSGEGSKSYDSV